MVPSVEKEGHLNPVGFVSDMIIFEINGILKPRPSVLFCEVTNLFFEKALPTNYSPCLPAGFVDFHFSVDFLGTKCCGFKLRV